MKIKSLTDKVPYTQVPAGGVFIRDNHPYISLNFTVFDDDGDVGFRYNAVDLIDGNAVLVEADEFVEYHPDALLSL